MWSEIQVKLRVEINSVWILAGASSVDFFQTRFKKSWEGGRQSHILSRTWPDSVRKFKIMACPMASQASDLLDVLLLAANLRVET